MKRVLLIEDDKTIRDNLSEMLTINNYRVYQAANGIEGLDMAKSIVPDIIVSDIKMPQMDGYDLVQKIRAIPALQHVPFIFITARIERQDLRMGMNLGADDYITKPFKAEELLASIQTRLHRQETLDASNDNATEKVNEVRKALETLTKTEKQILILVAGGMDNKALADKLFISKRTVEKHRANILQKLHLSGNNGLLRFVSLHKSIIDSLVYKD